LAANGL